ncbi:RsmG family class I SAM-dependent methyltransferase [Shigella boydii]
MSAPDQLLPGIPLSIVRPKPISLCWIALVNACVSFRQVQHELKLEKIEPVHRGREFPSELPFDGVISRAFRLSERYGELVPPSSWRARPFLRAKGQMPEDESFVAEEYQVESVVKL